MLQIGIQSFKSLKEAKDYTRAHLTELLGRGIFYSDYVDALVRRHPEIETKAPGGIIIGFRVQRNPRNPKAVELYLIRSDESEVDISWHTAIEAKGKTPAQNLRRAMRFSIREQIRAFTDKTYELPCQQCRTEPNEGVYFHIDHHTPTFHQLVTDFLNQWPAQLPEEFDDVPEINDAAFKPQDTGFELAWKLWHLNHAKLRKLCALCNLSRSKA